MADWRHLKKSGYACVGCGQEGGKTLLTKLATYALAFACLVCFRKYWNCGNCGHFPHPNGRHCKTCGCQEYRHGLAAEFDRQYAKGVGVTTALKECPSYGSKMGTCGKTIFADANGNFARLCPECDREWAEAVGAGIADMKGKFGLLDALEPVEEDKSGRVLH